jgi:ABC-type antimicrobial peptide transport system permease subunit
MIVSFVSILFGLILSLPLSIVASSFFGNLMLGEGASLEFAFSTSGFFITLFTTFAFGWLASRIPARNAIQVSTHEALSYE